MRFAGAFLFPKHAALQELSATLNLNGYARIKAKWGLSIQALVRRALDLGIVSRERYRSLMVQISGQVRTQKPVKVGIEKPAMMWTLLTRRNSSKPGSRRAGRAAEAALIPAASPPTTSSRRTVSAPPRPG